MGLWLATFTLFFLLWVISWFLADIDNFRTVDQMQHVLNYSKGIPFDGHVGMKYLDALPFPLLMATWVALCSREWSAGQIVGFLVAGFILSAAMHYTYIGAGKQFPEFVTYYGKLPPAFFEHVIYMGLGFAIVGLGYFCSSNAPAWLVWSSTLYLGFIHVPLGVHLIHKIWTPSWFPYHGIMDAGTLGPIIGTWVLLGFMTWWAL